MTQFTASFGATGTLEFPTESGSFETDLAIQFTGTWAGVFQFECTVDGTNWVSIQATKTSDGSVATSITSTGTDVNGIYRVIADGVRTRVRMSTYTSGTAAVTANVARSSV